MVKDASEYRNQAAECRQMGNRATGSQRDQLFEMAKAWEALADDSERERAKQARVEPLDPKQTF